MLFIRLRKRVTSLVVALNYADSEIVELNRDVDTLSQRAGDLAYRLDSLETTVSSDYDAEGTDTPMRGRWTLDRGLRPGLLPVSKHGLQDVITTGK